MEIKFISFARIHFHHELKSRLAFTHKFIHPSFGKLDCFYHLTMRFSRSFCSNDILCFLHWLFTFMATSCCRANTNWQFTIDFLGIHNILLGLIYIFPMHNLCLILCHARSTGTLGTRFWWRVHWSPKGCSRVVFHLLPNEITIWSKALPKTEHEYGTRTPTDLHYLLLYLTPGHFGSK